MTPNEAKAAVKMLRAVWAHQEESRRGKWRKRWMNQAELIGGWSKDPRTHVGCVFVKDNHRLMDGYNGLPRGVCDDPPVRWGPEEKYDWMCHAEASGVAKAARHGVSLMGSTCFVTHKPCSQCMSLMLNAGVAAVIYGPGKTSMPEQKFRITTIMCEEAGVRLEAY